MTAGFCDAEGGVEGAAAGAPKEKALPPAATGAGVVGALAGVLVPKTAVVLLPQVTILMKSYSDIMM